MTAFIIILASVYGLTIINNKSEQLEIPESFPMVSLAEIEQEDSLRLAPSGDYGNCILHNQTFFAPEQYTVRQAASVNGRQWADDSDRVYSPFLTMELYRLRFPALAVHPLRYMGKGNMGGLRHRRSIPLYQHRKPRAAAGFPPHRGYRYLSGLQGRIGHPPVSAGIHRAGAGRFPRDRAVTQYSVPHLHSKRSEYL